MRYFPPSVHNILFLEYIFLRANIFFTLTWNVDPDVHAVCVLLFMIPFPMQIYLFASENEANLKHEYSRRPEIQPRAFQSRGWARCVGRATPDSASPYIGINMDAEIDRATSGGCIYNGPLWISVYDTTSEWFVNKPSSILFSAAISK